MSDGDTTVLLVSYLERIRHSFDGTLLPIIKSGRRDVKDISLSGRFPSGCLDSHVRLGWIFLYVNLNSSTVPFAIMLTHELAVPCWHYALLTLLLRMMG